VVYISPDSGDTWVPIITGNSITSGDAAWGNHNWTALTAVGTTSLVSSRCLVMVEDYQEGSGWRDMSDRCFAIDDDAGTAYRQAAAHVSAVTGSAAHLFDLRDRMAARPPVIDGGSPPGLYIIQEHRGQRPCTALRVLP